MIEQPVTLWPGRLAPPLPTGTEIVKAACREFGFTREQMLAPVCAGGRGGPNHRRDARDATMARLKARGLSYTRIARLMGLKDHTSAMAAVRRHAKRIAEGQE